MEFTLSEKQLALKRLAHDFAVREVRPIAAERDRMQDPEACMAWDVIRKGSQLGLRTLSIPEEYGGGGADVLTIAIVAEELGWGDLGVAACFDQTWKYSPVFVNFTTPEQREKFLPEFMEDDSYLMAVAVTEPDAGTDNMFPYDEPGGGLMLSAERQGDEYVLNGTKTFISNGSTAKMCIVYARTDRSVGITRGTTAFLVPADTPGFRVGRVLDKLGRRLLMNAELVFENCRVPAFNRLGEENKAWEMQRGRNYGRGGYGATVLGTARAAFEDTLAHARERVQGGRPIIEHQNVALQLGEMYMGVEAARTVLHRAAWAVDHAEDYDPKLAFLAKTFCSETAFRVATMAVDIFAGYGYIKEYPIEKYMRDIISFLHGAGSGRIFRLKCAASL